MLILASSSPTRAKILRDYGVKFKQFFFNYDESKIDKKFKPNIYVQKVVLAKKEQFLSQNPDLKNILFVDSVVTCDNKILGKAKDEAEAKKMLELQSANIVKIVTSMLFLGEKFSLNNVSSTRYQFTKFDPIDLEKYLKSGDWQGKAGAMTIENFNKKYIITQQGNTTNAMGLNLELLKAFL
ncbi:MAG: septum formation inhibitor Maf [Campylobacter sp.]